MKRQARAQKAFKDARSRALSGSPTRRRTSSLPAVEEMHGLDSPDSMDIASAEDDAMEHDEMGGAGYVGSEDDASSSIYDEEDLTGDLKTEEFDGLVLEHDEGDSIDRLEEVQQVRATRETKEDAMSADDKSVIETHWVQLRNPVGVVALYDVHDSREQRDSLPPGGILVDDILSDKEIIDESEDARPLQQKALRPHMHALVITVSQYKDERLKALHSSVDADGEALSKALMDKLYGALDNVTVLKNPTKAAVEAAFALLASICTAESHVMVYLCCHGGRVTRGSKTKGSYLYCSDSVYGTKKEISSSAISLPLLGDMLKKVAGCHRSIFLEVSHSKKPRSSTAAFRQNVLQTKNLRLTQDFYTGLHECSRWLVVGSCTLTDELQERCLNDSKHGVFATHLLRSLRGATAKRGDLFLSIKAVSEYLRVEIPVFTKDMKETQTPVWFGELGGYLALAPAPPSKIISAPLLHSVELCNLTIMWPELRRFRGVPVDRYQMQYRGCLRASREWKTFGSTIDETHFRVPNLISGLQYEFRIRAGNVGGWGLYSDKSVPIRLREERDASLRSRVVNATEGGKKALLKLAREFYSEGTLQRGSLHGMVAFAQRNEISNTEQVELLELIVRAMRMYSWDAALQKDCINILGWMSYHSLEIYDRVVAVGGAASAMEDAARLFGPDEAMQYQIGWARRVLQEQKVKRSSVAKTLANKPGKRANVK